jgi:hypothetical protein
VMCSTTTKSKQPSTNCSKHEPAVEDGMGEGGIGCRVRSTRVSVFKPLDLHGRYPQQGRRWGSPWSGTRSYAWGHKTWDLYRFG